METLKKKNKSGHFC